MIINRSGRHIEIIYHGTRLSMVAGYDFISYHTGLNLEVAAAGFDKMSMHGPPLYQYGNGHLKYARRKA